MKNYQLIVIGGGPGGYTAALRAAKLGLQTALVENRAVGGTCLHRGCVPTKTLLHSSQVYREAIEGAAIGVQAGQVQADMPAIFARKRQVSETLSAGIEGMLKAAKVELLRGRGKILAADTVEVTAEDGSVQTYTCEKILAATGSEPLRPPIPGLELPGVMTSDELLEGCDHLYSSIIIIGGGVIGVEFATFYQELGSRVTIVEGMDRLLPTLDRELGQNLAMQFKKQEVAVHTGAMVSSLTLGGEGVEVHFTVKGEEQSVTGEVVLCAIGRKPSWEGLFAEGLQPQTNGRSLWVDENFQTSIPGVYAIGDISAKIQLAHMAAAQGIACVEKLCGGESSVRLDIVPSCIYSHPEIAVVGMTEAEAKAAGIACKSAKCVLGGNARTMIAGLGRSFLKLVADAESGALLGAQFMCDRSTDMISQIAQAIANNMTAQQLLLAMRPHPTFEEALGEVLEELCRKLAKV